MSKSAFLKSIIKPNQWKEILNFINTHFVPFEAVGLGLHATPEDLNDFHEIAVKKMLEHGLSVRVTEESSGALAGICLCKILTQQRSDIFSVEEKLNAKSHLLHSVLTSIENRVNIFQLEKVAEILAIGMISVDKRFSGAGISDRLVQEIERLGQQAGCQLGVVQTTGLASQHIFAKNGYETIAKINYEDIEINGKKILDLESMNGVTAVLVARKKFNKV